MNQHFPGYRYYMWLDTDTWIQDENSLHDFLYNARLYGAGLVLKDNHKPGIYGDDSARRNVAEDVYPKAYDDFIKGRNFYTCNAFCIDATTDFFDLWQQSAAEVHKKHRFKLGHELVTFVYAVHKCKQLQSVEPLDYGHCFTHRTEGLPVLGPMPDVLYVPSTLKPIGIVCFDNDMIPSVSAIFPLCVATEPLDFAACFVNKILYSKIEQYSTTHKKYPESMDLTKEFGQLPMQLASYYYDSWPTDDKVHVLSLLQQAQY